MKLKFANISEISVHCHFFSPRSINDAEIPKLQWFSMGPYSQDSLEGRKACGGRMSEIYLDLFSVQSEMCTFYCKNNKLITNSYIIFHT